MPVSTTAQEVSGPGPSLRASRWICRRHLRRGRRSRRAHARRQMLRQATVVAPPSRELPGPKRQVFVGRRTHARALSPRQWLAMRGAGRGGPVASTSKNGEGARLKGGADGRPPGRPPKTTHMGLGGSTRDRYRDLCLGRHQNSFARPRTCRSHHHLRENSRCDPAQPHPSSYWYLLRIGKRDCLCLLSCDRLNDESRQMARAALEDMVAPIFRGGRSTSEHRVPPGA